ncbi:major capsid protein [Macromonas bipunctata]|uniref:major capsid protein n=1 Tax=Macromonas bipunctata TaxID=183670 RepID=UPI000C338173|nr:major capsid protein [Macromonas bipunctata]
MDMFATPILARVVAALEPMQKPFLLNSFFPNVQLEATEEIRFDVEHRRRRLAPFVSPMVAGQVVQSQGYTTKSFKPAYIKDKRIFNPNRPFIRAMGERIGGEASPAQRLQHAVASELNDQITMLTRRQELMAAEVLRTGKTIVEGAMYPRVEVDFGRDPDLTLRLVDDARWGEGAAVDPLEDLAQWSKLVTQKSGALANIVVMDLKAWQLFSAAPSVQDLLDRQRGTATANPAVAGEGGRHMATIGDLEIWVYQSWFNDPDTDAQVPYLPPYTVILTGPDLEGTRCYGAIKDAEAGFQAVPYFAKSWDDEDPAVRYMMLQSAPLIVPYRVNASMCVTVR